MPTEIVTRTQQCAYCLTDTIVVTVEQLLSQRGEVVASTVLGGDPFASRVSPAARGAFAVPS